MNLPFAVAATLIVALLATAPTSASPTTSTVQATLLGRWWCEVWLGTGRVTTRPVDASNEADARAAAKRRWGQLGRIGRCQPE